MDKWEKIGWWIILGILIVILLASICYAEAPNFDGTIGLVVNGNFEEEVQRYLLDALRQRGYNIVLSEYKNNLPYKILAVNIRKISMRSDYGSNYTPDYIPSFNLKIGNYSQSINIDSSSRRNIRTHYDEVSVKMTIWQGNIAISSSQSVVPVTWREIYSSNRYNNRSESEEGLLIQGALMAAEQAFNQLNLRPSISTEQDNDSYYDDENFDLIVTYLIKQKNGLTYYRMGKGRTKNKAFQDALRAEEKILPQKK